MTKATSFLTHAAKAYLQYEEGHVAKQALKEHIATVRQLAKEEPSASAMQKALKELEEKVDIALEKQGAIVKHVAEEREADRHLLSRITALERQLDRYLKQEEERKKRLSLIERRMKRKEKA